MATGFLEAGGRSVTNSRISRQYTVENANDENDVINFVATLPTSIGGLPFTDFSAEESEEIEGMYHLTVNWAKSNNQTQNSVDYRFSFLAPSAHVYQSLETIATYRNTSVYPTAAVNWGGAINVVNDGGRNRVEGMQLATPAENFKLTYVTSNAVVNGAYQNLVNSLCGKVNSTTFRGYPAGSIMLVRAEGGRNSAGVWTLDFGFALSENATNIPVGAITVSAKDGWDLLWVYYVTSKDNTANSSAKIPGAAYIERVYKRADLNLLNLPS